MRHDTTYSSLQSFDTVLPVLADSCRQVTVYAAQKGIRTMVENHGFILSGCQSCRKAGNSCSTPELRSADGYGQLPLCGRKPCFVLRLCRTIRLLCARKGFSYQKRSEPSPGDGFFRSRGGNYLRGAIIGQGNVPIQQCLYALKRVWL